MQKDLQQLFNDYIYECRFSSRLRPETIRGYREAFRHFSNLMPEVKEAVSLSAEQMTEFFHRLHARKRIVGKGTEKIGVKDSTIKTYYSKLNSFFKWLVKKDLVEKNPLNEIKPPEPKYDDHKALDKRDLHKIISAISLLSGDNLLKKRDLAIVYILIFCGLRRGELVGLQVMDVDMEKRVLTIRGETSKSRHTRKIPMNPELFLQLEDYLKERKERGYKTEYLIVSTNKDTAFTTHGLKHWVNRLRRLSGVRFHLHQCRHSFATNLAKMGASSIIIQKSMGHTDLRMTERYLRSLGVEDLRSDINKLSLANLT